MQQQKTQGYLAIWKVLVLDMLHPDSICNAHSGMCHMLWIGRGVCASSLGMCVKLKFVACAGVPTKQLNEPFWRGVFDRGIRSKLQ